MLGNLGNYTLAPYKVVFKGMTSPKCFNVSSCRTSLKIAGDTEKAGDPRSHTAIPNMPSFPEEAYFLAGVLNSIPCRTALYSASVGVQTQRYFPTDVSRVRLPEFSPKDGKHSSWKS